MPYEVSLIDLLKARDEALYGRLLHVGDAAKKLLAYTQGSFPYYTPHGFSHSEAVQENLNWLLPDEVKEKLNTHEMFFLLVAAWMHDWGMVADADEDSTSVRERHHIRTENFFERLHDKIGLDSQEALVAGRISRGHRREDLYSADFNDRTFGQGVMIRVRFLSAILRIADEADVTHSRTPEVIYHSINPSGASNDEFRRHLAITGIGQLHERHKINLTAVARDPMGAKAVRQVRDKIQKELDLVGKDVTPSLITPV